MIEFEDDTDQEHDCWADYQDVTARQDVIEGIVHLTRLELRKAAERFTRACRLTRLAAANREIAYRLRVLAFADRSNAD
jgi:hypothetical protein